jgi:hypothetical protein
MLARTMPGDGDVEFGWPSAAAGFYPQRRKIVDSGRFTTKEDIVLGIISLAVVTII